MTNRKPSPRPTRNLRSAAWLAVAGLFVLFGCSRPLDRPLEGAQPSRGLGQSNILAEPPPTLTSPQVTTTAPPAPVIVVAPSPTASGSQRSPILSGLLPAPNAQIPPGPVNIGARVAGSNELSEVTLRVNGAAVKPQVTTQDQRIWIVSYTGQLDAGKHDVQLNARDRDGRAAGYNWQFEVRSGPSPTRTVLTAPTKPAGAQPAPRVPTPTLRATSVATPVSQPPARTTPGRR